MRREQAHGIQIGYVAAPTALRLWQHPYAGFAMALPILEEAMPNSAPMAM